MDDEISSGDPLALRVGDAGVVLFNFDSSVVLVSTWDEKVFGINVSPSAADGDWMQLLPLVRFMVDSCCCWKEYVCCID